MFAILLFPRREAALKSVSEPPLPFRTTPNNGIAKGVTPFARRRQNPEQLSPLLRLFMVADHFIDDEAQEFFAEVGVELGVFGQFAQAGDLAFFAAGVAGGQGVGGFVFADRLCDAESFGQHVDEGRIDIVDAGAIACQSSVWGGRERSFNHIRRASTSGQVIPSLPSRPKQRNAPTMTAQSLPSRSQSASMLAGEPSLDPILALTAAGMDEVNAVILDRMRSDIPLIPELAGHLISGGGKRMRPMLTIAAAELVGYAGGAQYALAAAVEFIHTATLLHDDVVDGSDLRRGKAAANIIYGNPATVLVGDYLFSRSFELMVEYDPRARNPQPRQFDHRRGRG
jgi:octaprenyl-diphosphate synthase